MNADKTSVEYLSGLMRDLLSRKDDEGRLIAEPFMRLSQAYAQPIRDGSITKSMWFEKILSNINSNRYATKKDLAADVGIVFSNAQIVHGEKSLIGGQAMTLNKQFERIMSTDDKGRRRAVLIAIGYTKEGSSFGHLPSHKHFQRMKQLIMSYGYMAEDIVMLADDDVHTQPTRSNILCALTNLVGDAKPEDRFFFYYCGHGAQITNNDGSETDDLDELIIPSDCVFDHNKPFHDVERYDNHIIDDLLNDILVKKIPVGAQLVALFDCCHAGTMMDLTYYRWSPRRRCTQEIFYEEPGPISGESEVQENVKQNSVVENTSNKHRSESGGPLNLPHIRTGVRTKRGTYVFRGESTDVGIDPVPKADVVSWSSSCDEQRSWQHPDFGGLMTQAFIETLEANKRPTYRELYLNIFERIKSTCGEIERDRNEAPGSIQQDPQVGFNNPPDMKRHFSL